MKRRNRRSPSPAPQAVRMSAAAPPLSGLAPRPAPRDAAVDAASAPADPVTVSDPLDAQGTPGLGTDEAVLGPAAPGYSLSPLGDKLHEQFPIDRPSLDTPVPAPNPLTEDAPHEDPLEQLLASDPVPVGREPSASDDGGSPTPAADALPPGEQPTADALPDAEPQPTPGPQPAAEPQAPAADPPTPDPQPSPHPQPSTKLQPAVDTEPRFEPFRGMQIYKPVTGVPAPVGPLVAVLRRPVLAMLPVLVLLVPALAFGLVRTPEWSARAQVLVGRVDVEAQAVPGFVAATQELAGTYARVVRTSVLAEQVADDLGVPVDSVAGRLSATPVPESSVIDILASGNTQEEAVELAAATSSALVSFVQVSTEAPERARELLEAYGDAARDQEQAERRLAVAQAELEAGSSATTLEERIAAVSEAQGEVDQFALRAEIAEEAYRNSQRGGSDRGIVQPIDEATSLGSDRNQTLALLVVAALIVGALLGVSLVTALANRHLLAGLRTPSPGPAFVR